MRYPIPTPVFKPGEAINLKITPDSTSFLNGIYKIDNDGYIDFGHW